MKRRELMALALALGMSASMQIPTVLAAESAAVSVTSASTQETSGNASSTGTSDGTIRSAGTGRSSTSGKVKQKVAAPENAIGKDAAKEKALQDAGLSADSVSKIRSRLKELEDGTIVYR